MNPFKFSFVDTAIPELEYSTPNNTKLFPILSRLELITAKLETIDAKLNEIQLAQKNNLTSKLVFMYKTIYAITSAKLIYMRAASIKSLTDFHEFIYIKQD